MAGAFSPRSCVLLAALAVAGVAVPREAEAVFQTSLVRQVSAVPAASIGKKDPRQADSPPVRLAGGDCSSAAAQVAAESGGQVLSVSSRQQGGQTVCVVTVLIPGEDGSRPRKKTITVPQ